METEERIYFYKMTTDNGGAPCSYNSILTLAICMSKIRATAQENDWIVGFGGVDLAERSIYVAQVKEKLLNGKYYKNEKYYERQDCIYRWNAPTQKYYWENGKNYHADGLHLDHDLDNGNALVLLSEKYTYFGNRGTTDYKRKYPKLDKCLKRLRRGHRVNHCETLFSELQELIQESIDSEIDGEPSDQDTCKACNNTDGKIIECSRKRTKCV